MNEAELSAVRTVQRIIVENLNVNDIFPFLYQHNLLSQNIEDEYSGNAERRERCRRFVDYLLSDQNKCSFNSLVNALKYNNGYGFVADILQNALDERERKNESKQSSCGDTLPPAVRKIPVSTSQRNKISAFYLQLQKLSLNAEFDKLNEVIGKIEYAFKMKRSDTIQERMCLSDFRFATLEAVLGVKREKYDHTLDSKPVFTEMQTLMPFTTDPHVSNMLFLARTGSAVAMDNQNANAIDDGLMYLQFAKEHAENILPGKDTGMVYYIEANLLLQKYEMLPTVEMKNKLLKTIEVGISQFSQENDEIRRNFQRQFMVKMAYCYLGLGVFGNKINTIEVGESDRVAAKHIFDCVETGEIWNGIEKRRKMLFYHAKAEYFRQIGNFDYARLFSSDAKQIATENKWTKELPNITLLLDDLKSKEAISNENINKMLKEIMSPEETEIGCITSTLSTYKTPSNQLLVQDVYNTTETKSLPSPATPALNSHSTLKTSNANTFSAKLDGETALKSIMCDASNPNIIVHEKKPARGRPRDSRLYSRAEKRSESAKPYNRQGSKSRKGSQNRSSQSRSSKNSNISMGESVHCVSVGGVCADQGQPNCGIK